MRNKPHVVQFESSMVIVDDAVAAVVEEEDRASAEKMFRSIKRQAEFLARTFGFKMEGREKMESGRR